MADDVMDKAAADAKPVSSSGVGGSIVARPETRADRARRFSKTSSGVGRTGFLVTRARTRRREQTQTGNEGGQLQPAERSRKVSLTIRSSSE